MLTKILTLILMAVFYICYFGKAISQKKKGITTNQLGKGKTGFVKSIELSLKTATCIIPFVQIASIVLYSETKYLILQIIGVFLTAVGVTFFILSVLQMKDNWRAGVSKEEKTSLVTSGVYSISRNPAFLGFELMYIGILFSFFNPYLFILTTITVTLFHLQIVNVEEDFLKNTFGEEYINYTKKVCRYIGRKF